MVVMSVAASESVLATARRSVPVQISNDRVTCVIWVDYTHDIRLGPDSHQPVDVFAYRYQYFACHMSTLFCSRCLIFNVDASCSLLNEQLCQLHNRRQTTMTRVRICDDRPQEIGVRNLAPICFGRADALFALLPVMEELGREEVMYFVRDRILKSP